MVMVMVMVMVTIDLVDVDRALSELFRTTWKSKLGQIQIQIQIQSCADEHEMGHNETDRKGAQAEVEVFATITTIIFMKMQIRLVYW